MPRYGMVIDLARCYGCDACALACRDEHGTPAGVTWARVLKREVGTPPDTARIPLPLLCMQCAQPSCVSACAFGAMKMGDGGIVAVDEGACTGCGLCGPACPYDAVYFADGFDAAADQKLMNEREQAQRAPWLRRFAQGTATKCDFCRHRIRAGRPPACVAICPVKAHLFGDLDDPGSEVARLVRKPGTAQLHSEWGTAPKVFYVPPEGMTVSEVMALGFLGSGDTC